MNMRRVPFFTLIVVSCLHAHQVEEISVYYKKEKINGSEFVYRCDEVNGAVKKSWTINGQSVEKTNFDESIIQAEMHERMQERAQQEQRLARQQELRLTLQRQMHQKVLTAQVQEVTQELAKFKEHDLQKFLAFGAESFSEQQEFDDLVHTVLPQAKKLVDPCNNEVTVTQLQAMSAQLKSMPTKLSELFYATVKQAISHYDDPQILKNLLAMV